jgi:hypothetical protein
VIFGHYQLDYNKSDDQMNYCIASPHKNELWYDYRLYVNLKHELEKLGHIHCAGARNRIYFLGGPQKLFYPKVGQFDSKANNIALVYCHPEKLKSLDQFDKVFVCSKGFREYFHKKSLATNQPIEIIPPFSSLKPVAQNRPRYDCDVSFMGVPRVRPALDAVLPLVDELGITLSLFGPGWNNYPNGQNLEKYWVARQIPYQHIPQLTLGSKICLLDHHESMNTIGSISHKYVDFVMSGGFVVSDYNQDAIDNYQGICFSEKRPLKDILQEYLADEGKRKEHIAMQQQLMIKQTTHAAAKTLAESFV